MSIEQSTIKGVKICLVRPDTIELYAKTIDWQIPTTD